MMEMKKNMERKKWNINNIKIINHNDLVNIMLLLEDRQILFLMKIELNFGIIL